MKKLLVILLVLGLVAPAMAAEWNMYGSARVRLFYNQYDDDYMTTHAGTVGTDSDTDLDMALQGNARVGANVKTSDVVTGRFEYGTGVNVRLLYGEYHFGSGSLLVGQDYTPIDTLYSDQVIEDDNDLLFDGMAYEGRLAQLKLKMGGFQAALIGPNTSGLRNSDKDVTIPKIELAFDMPLGAASVGAYAGFQTYDATADNTATSYLVGVRAKINAGPLYINPNVFYAINAGNYGMTLRDAHSSILGVAGSGVAFYNEADDEDASTFGAAVAIGAKINDAFGVEGGIGYLNSAVTTNALGDVSLTTLNYYVQCTITLAPGVFLVPNVSIEDLGTIESDAPDVDLGQVVYYGAKFQINF